jgi:hypothetical protein
LPALFVSHSFVSAETPKMTLHYTYWTVHFLVLILLFCHEFGSDEQIFFFGLLSTRLHSNNPLEMFGIWLYLLYSLVWLLKTVPLWPVNKLPLISSCLFMWHVQIVLAKGVVVVVVMHNISLVVSCYCVGDCNTVTIWKTCIQNIVLKLSWSSDHGCCCWNQRVYWDGASLLVPLCCQ